MEIIFRADEIPDDLVEFFEPLADEKTDVWRVSTKPYRQAHFATFPPDLIEPCILAGTSAKGHCPQCGAAWERVTELGAITSKGGGNGRVESGQVIQTRGDYNTGKMTAREHVTKGWQPSCACNVDPVPDLVLDPFGGSGTTAEVAIKHGRRAVLIELNPQYVELQRARLGRVQMATA